MDRLARLANSHQGRKLVHQAKEMANDPRRRQQAKDALDKVRTKAEEVAKKQRPRH